MASIENADASKSDFDGGDKDFPDVFPEEEKPAECKETATDQMDIGGDGKRERLSDGSREVNNTKNGSPCKPTSGKKKHRRGSRRSKKRKYKPYSQLTWEEKKAVEERDSRRAVSIREKYMHQKGRPLAPFNTSQFLMAEHDTQEPDLHISHHHRHHHESRSSKLSSSADDSEDDHSSGSDEDEDIEDVRNFLQKDFTETYDRFHLESLHSMNKGELVNEYMQLEDKVENLEKELTDIKSNGMVKNGSSNFGDRAGMVGGGNFKDDGRRQLELEIEKLREENRILHLENNTLRPKQNMGSEIV